jgi:hypothetical protein
MLDIMNAGGYGIAVAVISIMLAASGIILGMGFALDDRKLKEFGRNELYQAIINGAIVGSLLVCFLPGGIVSSSINGLVANSSYPSCEPPLNYNSAICFAHDYLAGISPITINGNSYPSFTDSVMELLVPTFSLYLGIGALAAVQINLVVVSFSFGNLLNPVLHQIGYVLEGLTLALLSIQAQDALLRVIAGVAVPLLLPVGVILRSFYFTRKLGGAIMAASIALFAVFPLSYVLDSQVMSYYSYSTLQPAINATISSTQSASSTVLSGIPSTQPSNSISSGAFQSLANAADGVANGAESLVRSLIQGLALLIVQVFFLPVFSIMLTTISARELARILGSEISFGKFGML